MGYGVGTFLKIMIGTRVLKIYLEIAEIIEVKVATFNIEIIFLPLLCFKCLHIYFLNMVSQS